MIICIMLDGIKSIKQKYTLKQLRKEQPLKQIVNMDTVKNIAIVFHVGDELSWKYLYAIVRELEKANKRVFLIGDQAADMELNYIITHSQTTICHEKEDFDFWCFPKENVVENFFARHYDILIDVTSGDSFFSQYMVLKSGSDLNITYVDDSQEVDPLINQLYDFTIHGKEPIVLPDFFENVCNYLQMVQK